MFFHKNLLFFIVFLSILPQIVDAQKDNSVLSTGKWVKITIEKTGIYQISYKKLSELGFNNPNKIRIFGNANGMLPFMNNEAAVDDLDENSVWHYNNSVYFFAQSANVWSYDKDENMYLPKNHLFSKYSYYFITDIETNFDNSIKTSPQETSNDVETTYKSIIYAAHEQDLINLQMSGRKWYGESFYLTLNRRISVDLPLPAIENAKAKISFITRSNVANFFDVKIANTTKQIFCNSTTTANVYATTQTETFDYIPENTANQQFDITFNKNSASSEGYLDYIVVNAYSNLVYSGNQFIFNWLSNKNYVDYKISVENFSPIIWDVTKPNNPLNINYKLSNKIVNFISKSDTAARFIIFQPEDAYNPTDFQIIKNQNLHSLQPVEYLVITPENLEVYAQKIAKIHSSEMSTSVVNCQQIYNEFSSGMPDVSALRNFIRFLYKKDNGKTLKYVLLFGDGSVDNYSDNQENTNLILTYQSPNSLNENNIYSFVSDDFFGLLDDDEGEYFGKLDVGIGRLPVKNVAEAEIAVEKIKAYLSEKSVENWHSFLSFVADDEDFNAHVMQSDFIGEFCEENYPEYNIEKIYLDAYPQQTSASGDKYPAARSAIINRFNNGAQIVNYTGHGGMDFFADEMVLTINDIDNLKNVYKLPLFITATCDVGRFDYYDKQSKTSKDSPAERFLNNADGGAIALITATRAVLSNPNFEFNKNIFKYVLHPFDNNGNVMRLGDVIRLAKLETSDYNMLNFTLLGDPALTISNSRYKAILKKINGKEIENFSDTIKALEKVEFEGIITDLNGSLSNSFNGNLYPIFYDKLSTEKTLNNDNTGIFEYKTYNKIVYKGNVTVRNGNFKFSFVVPKDINPQVDFSKLTFFAKNGLQSALGHEKRIKIGSVSDNAALDLQGPDIKLYLNDFSFVDGDKTNSNPLLIVCLSDSSGINTIDGSGHDIVAEIDGNKQNSSTLNRYFVYNQDSYTNGKIEFQLDNLQEGSHTLKLKAWDNYNNASVAQISFNVVNSNGLTISRLFNYPNPFTDKTLFYFEHNCPQSIIDYELTIFSVSGKQVKTLTGSFYGEKFLSPPIEWNGADDFGDRIGRGVYFYCLKIRNSDGQIAKKYEKLLYLK